MKRVYGYIRVSTPKQGTGVSLEVQKADITEFAKYNQYHIIDWFVEKHSASKKGRNAFNEMVTALEQGKADGVLFHNIDRSIRNGHDWLRMTDFIEDGGIARFVRDDFDFFNSSERLGAELKATYAAHYSRNLSYEATKGLRGRMKDGIYPLSAPVGYLDRGRGELKKIHKKKAPLVTQAFEKYATGKYSINELRISLGKKGLTNSKGNTLSKTAFSKMLHNPFYAGILRLRSSGELFEGKHTAIISMPLYNAVQRQLEGKTIAKRTRHDFLFKARIFCYHCKKVMTGELQKGHVYYRCHNKNCTTTTVREDTMEAVIEKYLGSLRFSKEVIAGVEAYYHKESTSTKRYVEKQCATINLTLGQLRGKLERLNDKFVDDHLDEDTYLKMKNKLVKEITTHEQKLIELPKKAAKSSQNSEEFELCNNALNTYQIAPKEQKRELVEKVFSNFFVEGKKPLVKLKEPFQGLFEAQNVTKCWDSASGVRIYDGEFTPRREKISADDIINIFSQTSENDEPVI